MNNLVMWTCEAEVLKRVNALALRLQTRTLGVKVFNKNYRISHDFGHTVKITFARNAHDVDFHEFSFHTIQYLQDRLQYVWRSRHAKYAPGNEHFCPLRFCGAKMMSGSSTDDKDDDKDHSNNDSNHDNNQTTDVYDDDGADTNNHGEDDSHDENDNGSEDDNNNNEQNIDEYDKDDSDDNNDHDEDDDTMNKILKMNRMRMTMNMILNNINEIMVMTMVHTVIIIVKILNIATHINYAHGHSDYSHDDYVVGFQNMPTRLLNIFHIIAAF